LKTSEIMQLISHFALIVFLGFPVIVMMIKTLEWEKKSARDYRLHIHQFMFVSIMILSTNLMGRSEFIASCLFFVTPAAWVIFSYQVPIYEPGYSILENLKSRKKLFALPLLALILMLILYQMIPGELVAEQISMTRVISEEVQGEESYNFYRIRQWFSENPDLLETFDGESLRVAQKGMHLIVLEYRRKDQVVHFLYELDRNRWRLQGIHEFEDPSGHGV